MKTIKVLISALATILEAGYHAQPMSVQFGGGL
jgi:hypothetical protein